MKAPNAIVHQNFLTLRQTASYHQAKTVVTFVYTTSTDDKGSLEYLLTKEKALADTASSEDQVLEKRNFDNLVDCVSLSTFIRDPTYHTLLTVKANAGTQRTMASLLDTCAGPALINSLLIPPNWGFMSDLLRYSL